MKKTVPKTTKKEKTTDTKKTTITKINKKPILVLIRDGWGYRQEESYNAPVKGMCPYTKELMKNYPTTLLDASGESVGLPKGYQGNSEVGHMTIGAGRIIFQSLERINADIENGDFFKNTAFIGAINNAKKNKTNIHIIGLLQQEGVHAHINHLFALLDLCKKENFKDVLVHVISDGRDSQVNGTINNVKLLQKKFKEIGFGKIATISGRYYTMDRDNRWDRTKLAYDAIVNANSANSVPGLTFTDPVLSFEQSYAKKETDEFIIPKSAKDYTGIKPKDSFIFYNFRTDRTRQLTKAIIEDKFEGWDRKPLDIYYVAMTEYYTPMSNKVKIAFLPQSTQNLLGNILADNNKTQLRISETEKYAHVTFFFNGQIETPNKGEDRILVQSPKVATYDLQPEMSVAEVGDKIVEALNKDKYDVIITNFVNGDMVGHTGKWDAVLKAVNAVDENVKKVVTKVLEKQGTVLIFADHGNCEEMDGPNQTSHTTNPVPFILVSADKKLTKVKLKSCKGLKDIAPTVLKLLGIKPPKEMTGESIF